MTAVDAEAMTLSLQPHAADELRCRTLLPRESPLYRALRLDCLIRYPDFFADTFDEESRRPHLLFEPAIEEGARDSFMLGAFRAGRLLGVAGFLRRDRRKTSHCGDLKHVYVLPEHRGRAIGRSLVQAVLEQAFDLPGLERIELTVVSANAPARRLYETLGFETWGVQENQLRVGARCWHLCHMRLTRERYRVAQR